MKFPQTMSTDDRQKVLEGGVAYTRGYFDAEVIQLGESPIEQLFLTACLGFLWVDGETYCNWAAVHALERNRPPTQIDGFKRILVHSYTGALMFVQPTLQLDGLQIRPDFLVCTMGQVLMVELDGHEFHERTKEQSTRDKSRDRVLQSLGWRAYRYSGSEIWADACKAVLEITDICQQIVAASRSGEP